MSLCTFYRFLWGFSMWHGLTQVISLPPQMEVQQWYQDMERTRVRIDVPRTRYRRYKAAQIIYSINRYMILIWHMSLIQALLTIDILSLHILKINNFPLIMFFRKTSVIFILAQTLSTVCQLQRADTHLTSTHYPFQKDGIICRKRLGRNKNSSVDKGHHRFISLISVFNETK